MIVDIEEGGIGGEHRIERTRRAAGLRRVEVRDEGIAAERTARKEKVHVLQVPVEAWRHVDPIEHAEAIAKGTQRRHQPGGERAHAVAAPPNARLLTQVVLDLTGPRHRQRASVEHVGGVGPTIEHHEQEEMRIAVRIGSGRRAGARQHQGAGAEATKPDHVASRHSLHFGDHLLSKKLGFMVMANVIAATVSVAGSVAYSRRKKSRQAAYSCSLAL